VRVVTALKKAGNFGAVVPSARIRKTFAKTSGCPFRIESEFHIAMASPRILIVEDNRADQYALTQLLTRFDYESDVAPSGESAIELLGATRFAAILMDISLPGMDGFECTAKLRLIEKDGRRRTPVIALSAWIGQEINEKCRSAGMDDYVSKPVHAEHLRKVLLRYVYDPTTPNLKTLKPLSLEDIEFSQPFMEGKD
jgi:CheY-like chemotaxis protein